MAKQQLMAEITEQLYEALKSVEWGKDGSLVCLRCGYPKSCGTHYFGCKVDIALKAYERAIKRHSGERR